MHAHTHQTHTHTHTRSWRRSGQAWYCMPVVLTPPPPPILDHANTFSLSFFLSLLCGTSTPFPLPSTACLSIPGPTMCASTLLCIHKLCVFPHRRYRNPIKEVANMLEDRHPGAYMIFNLSSREYDRKETPLSFSPSLLLSLLRSLPSPLAPHFAPLFTTHLLTTTHTHRRSIRGPGFGHGLARSSFSTAACGVACVPEHSLVAAGGS